MTSHVWKEPSGRRQFLTVGARLRWSYANLAMAHAALREKAERYRPFPHFQIRAKLYAGLSNGTMSIGPLFDDERLKLLGPVRCAYCGSNTPSTADHLLPRIKGGTDAGENLVACCRACNSAKGGRDVMVWYRGHDRFPALSIVRRYLKIATANATEAGAMNWPADDPATNDLLFTVAAVPMVYPAPGELCWETPEPPPEFSKTPARNL